MIYGMRMICQNPKRPHYFSLESWVWVHLMEKSGKIGRSKSPYLPTQHLIRKQRNRENQPLWSLPDGRKPDGEDRMILTTKGQLSSAFNRRREDTKKQKEKKNPQGGGGWAEAPYDHNPEEGWLLGNDGANRGNQCQVWVSESRGASETVAEMGGIIQISGISSLKGEYSHDKMKWSWHKPCKE